MVVPEPAVPVLVVAAYDPAWQRRRAALAEELRTALGPLARRVEHNGSTAIPGMAAKPVYDFQVSVDDLDAAATAFDAPLAALGLVRRPYRRDHVPAGRDDPPHRWAKRLWGKPGTGGERVIVHCRLVGSPNERLALLFRDWFRAHLGAVPAYCQVQGGTCRGSRRPRGLHRRQGPGGRPGDRGRRRVGRGNRLAPLSAQACGLAVPLPVRRRHGP